MNMTAAARAIPTEFPAVPRFRLRALAPAAAAILAALAWAPRAPGGEVAGVTKPYREATISSSVPGTLKTVLVKEGDRVESGQPLIELDRVQEELEVARRKLIWEDRAESRAVTARVATAKADLEGTRKLYEASRSVSREELDKKQLEYDLSVAEEAKVAMTEERERIEYDMAMEVLSRRTIRSPMKAVVTELKAHEGEGCEMRQPLIKLVDVSQCYFVANVEAPVLASLRIDQELALRVDGPSGPVPVRARICYLAPVVDAASGLGELKAVFDNPDGAIRPGVGAAMTLPEDRRRGSP